MQHKPLQKGNGGKFRNSPPLSCWFLIGLEREFYAELRLARYGIPIHTGRRSGSD